MSIVIEKLNYVYMAGGPYETKALNDVSLTIGDGEFVSIIGLSGAGKSTLIRCMNRLETPTSGRILVDGENILDMNPRQLRQLRWQRPERRSSQPEWHQRSRRCP